MFRDPSINKLLRSQLARALTAYLQTFQEFDLLCHDTRMLQLTKEAR